jgi:hypothetical protein
MSMTENDRYAVVAEANCPIGFQNVQVLYTTLGGFLFLIVLLSLTPIFYLSCERLEKR